MQKILNQKYVSIIIRSYVQGSLRASIESWYDRDTVIYIRINQFISSLLKKIRDTHHLQKSREPLNEQKDRNPLAEWEWKIGGFYGTLRNLIKVYQNTVILK